MGGVQLEKSVRWMFRDGKERSVDKVRLGRHCVCLAEELGLHLANRSLY
jgi:hypothetical protein